MALQNGISLGIRKSISESGINNIGWRGLYRELKSDLLTDFFNFFYSHGYERKRNLD